MKDIGQKLKDARERKGFSVNEVSIAIKINTKTLQAIEEGDVNQLPAKPFLRGFVQTYSKYLDLNVDEVMKIFAEEIGTTRPQIQNDPTTQTESVEKTEEVHRQFDTFKKVGFIAAALVAIGLVYFIQKTVGKYEKEQQVAETQKSVLIGSQDTKTDANQPTAEASSTTAETNTGTTTTQEATGTAPAHATTEAQPTTVAQTTATTSPAAPVAAKVETPPTPTAPLILKPTTQTTTATPTKTAPAPTTQPEATAPKPPAETKPVVKTEPPQPVAAVKPPAETLKKAPQQIIIEALDNVEIRYQKDGEAEKTVRLKPEQILTLSADYKVSINVNDGGAVSVIRNGREIGVPGSLGKPAKLNYP